VATVDEKFSKAFERLTKGMSEGDLRRLMFVMCIFELKRGEVLVKEGQHAESLYIVQTGALRVTVGEGAGRIEFPEVTAGYWVGEVSLLDPGPASATVQVVRATSVLEFSHTALKAYVKSNPAGARVILEALALGLADRLHRTSDGLIKNDAGRLLQADAPPVKHHGWFKDMLLNLSETP
jgi:CRP/FNR family cyclic AMP-dependent transcriptional regulator